MAPSHENRNPSTLITECLDIWITADTVKKSGRGRASSNAGSVYGIKKLRELILELAIRGKLVPQDPKDEPASELLKRIETEKVKIKKDKQLPTIKNITTPFNLPAKWEWARLGNILTLEYGDNLPAEKRSESGKFPVYGSNGVVGTHDVAFVKSPCIVVGRKGSAGALNLSLSAGCCVTDVAYYCVPPKQLDLIFIFKLFHTLGLDLLGKGIKPGLNRSEAYELLIAMPPINEQRRIVTKVDELMALCDQLEAQHKNATEAHEKIVSVLLETLTQSTDAKAFKENWQRIATHFDTLFTTESSIDSLKQTLLQLAVMGKLVLQDANDEPARKLLKRIQIEKDTLVTKGTIKINKPSSSVTEKEKAFKLPHAWEWTRLIDCAKQITDGEHLTPQRTGDTSQIPLVTAKNVRDGKMDYDVTDYVDLDVATKCWNRCKPEVNDILIVSVGATIGRLTIVDDHRDMVIVRSVTLVKPLLINIEYLALCLRSPLLQKSIWSGVKQNAQPCLYLSVSNNLPIPLPPIEEQSRIVAKINELTAICNEIKVRIFSANALQQILADVMIEKAVA